MPSRDELLQFSPGAFVKAYEILSPAETVLDPPGFAPPLGAGGSGVVYLARQSLGAGVALKRAIKFFVYRDDIANMTPHGHTGPVSNAEFLDEVTNIARLSHEYLVKIIDAGTYASNDVDIPFIVTDFVPGPTLKEVVAADPSPEGSSAADVRDYFVDQPVEVLQFLLHLAAAVEYVHQQGFAHCDIAPKNVFVDTRASIRPVLGDLGVMRNLSVDRPSTFIVGTLDYMPPEIRDHLNHDLPWAVFKTFHPRWDVYSYCATARQVIRALVSPLYEKNPEAAPSWLPALLNELEQLLRTSATTMTEIVARLEFLLPAHRVAGAVPELSGSVTNKRRRLMPVEVPSLSPRMFKLTRHPALIRLARVPQVTSVRQLFPGSKHDRFEHSLGAVETVRRYLLALLDEPVVLEHLSPAKIELALLGGLLFNLTRFPFSSVIHEVRHKDPTRLQQFSPENILDDVLRMRDRKERPLTDLIERDFPRVELDRLIALILGRKSTFDESDHFIYSLLSSSLDARVVDFVRRDSLHIGVTRGDAFDLGELLPHLTIYSHKLAVRSTGVSVVEQILALRYWLFNRVYWNRANRAYSAMVRHLVTELLATEASMDEIRTRIIVASEDDVLQLLKGQAVAAGREDLVAMADLLLENDQVLYRAIIDVTPEEDPEMTRVHSVAVGMDFTQLGELGRRAAQAASELVKDPTQPAFLVDVPFEPGSPKLGDDIMVIRPNGGVDSLTRFSPIVDGLNHGFNTHLRRLRVFAPPEFLEKHPQRSEIATAVRSLLLSSAT